MHVVRANEECWYCCGLPCRFCLFFLFWGCVYWIKSYILTSKEIWPAAPAATHHGANWKPVNHPTRNHPTPQPTLSWIEARSVHLTFAKRLCFFRTMRGRFEVGGCWIRGWLPIGDLRGVEDLGVYYISISTYVFCLSVLSVSKCTSIYIVYFCSFILSISTCV